MSNNVQQFILALELTVLHRRLKGVPIWPAAPRRAILTMSDGEIKLLSLGSMSTTVWYVVTDIISLQIYVAERCFNPPLIQPV
jgi:hypothetical protein